MNLEIILPAIFVFIIIINMILIIYKVKKRDKGITLTFLVDKDIFE